MRAAVIAIIGAVASFTSLAGVAHADAFGTAAGTATKVKHVDELVWALGAPCDRGDDVEQRQCRVLRDRAAAPYLGQTVIVEADADAFTLGAWDAARKSVPMKLTNCIRCRGIDLDGRAVFVIGSGTPAKFEGGQLRPTPLYDNARRFTDEAAAKAWMKTLKGVRVDLIVKVPDKRGWKVGGKDGLALDIVGYRVVSPCDGSIIASSPEATALAADKAMCKAPSILDEQTGGQVPDALTDTMIQTAMKPVFTAATACYDHYGQQGTATLTITVADDGTVSKYQQQGDLSGTPSGVCLDTAMKATRFPRTKRGQSKFTLNIVLGPAPTTPPAKL